MCAQESGLGVLALATCDLEQWVIHPIMQTMNVIVTLAPSLRLPNMLGELAQAME